MKTLIMTGGGTAGHVTPALALLPELKKRFDRIVYVGSKDGIERELAQKSGIEFYYVPTVKLERKFTLKNALIPFKLFWGISEAKKLLFQLNPSAVFSKGGYVSLPTVIGAKKLGVPVISHESDMSVGLANKIGAKYSDLFLTSFDVTKSNCKNTVFTGSPLREELFAPKDKTALLKKYRLSGRKKILLVFGGSSGSKIINQTLEKCLYKLMNRYDIVHICGKGKGEDQVEKGYVKMQFCPNMEDLLHLADLVVCRAGANSLFELTALNKPTLAIPLSTKNSRGDQIENAEYFKKRKMIEVLKEENLTENSLYSSILKLETSAPILTQNCKGQNGLNANKKIAELIFKFSEKTTC